MPYKVLNPIVRKPNQLIPPAPFSSGKRRGSSDIRLSGDIRQLARDGRFLLESIPEVVLQRLMDHDAIPPLFRLKRGGWGVSSKSSRPKTGSPSQEPPLSKVCDVHDVLMPALRQDVASSAGRRRREDSKARKRASICALTGANKKPALSSGFLRLRYSLWNRPCLCISPREAGGPSSFSCWPGPASQYHSEPESGPS